MDQSVLLLATDQRLLVVDFTKPEKLGKLDTPVALGNAVKVFNFVEKGFPFGATFFCRENKLYMIGGEITRPGLSEDDLRTPSRTNLVESFGNGGLSSKIYVADLTTKMDSIGDLHFRELLTMHAPKSSPIVEEIEGKYYILSGPSWHYKDLMPEPSFEVYDPEFNRLEALPNPPFYEGKKYTICKHFVVGNTIHISANAKNYSYSIIHRKWVYLPNWSEEIPVKYSILPTGVGAAFVPAYNDVLIQFTRQMLCAWMILPDGSLPNPLPQDLISSFYYQRDLFPVWGEGATVATGQKSMCIMRPRMIKVGNEIRRLIYVGIFQVEKLLPQTETAASSSSSQQASSHRPSSGSFIKPTHTSIGIYSVDDWGIDMPMFRSVFLCRGLTGTGTGAGTGTDDESV